MRSVILSPKYQIVIPKRIREKLTLKPGIRLQIIGFDNRIELIPLRPMSEMRGCLKGLDSTFIREDSKDRV